MMKNPVIGAKIILLKDERYTVSEIRMATNHHDVNIRKWIHSIVSTKKVLKVLYPENTYTIKPIKISDNIERKR